MHIRICYSHPVHRHRIMKRRYRKQCPVCLKPQLLRLAGHLAQQHNLDKAQRSEYLRTTRKDFEHPQVIYRRFEKKLLAINPEHITREEKKALLLFAKRDKNPDQIVTKFIESDDQCPPTTVTHLLDKFQRQRMEMMNPP